MRWTVGWTQYAKLSIPMLITLGEQKIHSKYSSWRPKESQIKNGMQVFFLLTTMRSLENIRHWWWFCIPPSSHVLFFFSQCCRYFCELLLDNSLFARTSSKQKSEMCFWGEQFEFSNLPSLETITIILYREACKKRKKVPIINISYYHRNMWTIPTLDFLLEWFNGTIFLYTSTHVEFSVSYLNV